jgi:acyl-CoA thioester hydrolase
LIAPAESQAEIVWVALRHEIDYKHPALLEDAIILRTWVGAAEGLRFERYTEVLRSMDRKLLAQARTVWCPIDPRTNRPKRVSDEVRRLFSTGKDTRQAYP